MSTDDSRLPKVLASRIVDAEGRFPTEQLDLEFRNGQRRRFERLMPSGRGAVLIVPILDDQVLLIREYCCGVHRYELGLPKGRLEAGEDVLDGANRELKEEVGYGARRLEIIHRLTLAPTYMGHITHVVLARDLYPERLPGDEPEIPEVQPWPLADIDELAFSPEISEGRSIAALFLGRAHLRRHP